jgi:hypothetical protein
METLHPGGAKGVFVGPELRLSSQMKSLREVSGATHLSGICEVRGNEEIIDICRLSLDHPDPVAGR